MVFVVLGVPVVFVPPLLRVPQPLDTLTGYAMHTTWPAYP